MIFTAEELAALKAIEEAFGPYPEADPENVEALYVGSYLRSIPQYVGYAVNHWKAAELAANPELPAIKQRIREDKAREYAIKNAARSQEVRESLVSGILSGLVPKARKAGAVSFSVNDWVIKLSVTENLSSTEVFELTYDRGDFTLDAFLKDKEFELEDWSALNGNARPRDQSVAYAEIVGFLESLEPSSSLTQTTN